MLTHWHILLVMRGCSPGGGVCGNVLKGSSFFAHVVGGVVYDVLCKSR